MQLVVSSLRVDDPALIVEVTNLPHLHACLGLATSPIPPAANPIASFDAFRNWLANTALTVPGITPNNQKGRAAWDHLSEQQAHDIIHAWTVIPWAHSILQGNMNPPATLLWVSGTGKGRAHMFRAGMPAFG
jgi:hypothetical protein